MTPHTQYVAYTARATANLSRVTVRRTERHCERRYEQSASDAFDAT